MHATLALRSGEIEGQLTPHNLVVMTDQYDVADQEYLAAGILMGFGCTTDTDRAQCIENGRTALEKLPHQRKLKTAVLPTPKIVATMMAEGYVICFVPTCYWRSIRVPLSSPSITHNSLRLVQPLHRTATGLLYGSLSYLQTHICTFPRDACMRSSNSRKKAFNTCVRNSRVRRNTQLNALRSANC